MLAEWFFFPGIVKTKSNAAIHYCTDASSPQLHAAQTTCPLGANPRVRANSAKMCLKFAHSLHLQAFAVATRKPPSTSGMSNAEPQPQVHVGPAQKETSGHADETFNEGDSFG